MDFISIIMHRGTHNIKKAFLIFALIGVSSLLLIASGTLEARHEFISTSEFEEDISGTADVRQFDAGIQRIEEIQTNQTADLSFDRFLESVDGQRASIGTEDFVPGSTDRVSIGTEDFIPNDPRFNTSVEDIDGGTFFGGIGDDTLGQYVISEFPISGVSGTGDIANILKDIGLSPDGLGEIVGLGGQANNVLKGVEGILSGDISKVI